MHYNYIVIEGNIGSGKTSLATMIARNLNAKLILERFEDNSFLPKFYKNPEQYAFPLEMSFLSDRYQQLKDELTNQDLFKNFTVADYFIDKSLIFARNNLQNEEFALYSKLFDIINLMLPKPQLIVYLYNSTENLLKNIRLRGRSYEQNITASYLDHLQHGYINYFHQKKDMRVLIIDTQTIDFVRRDDDYKKVIEVIQDHYHPGVHRIRLD
ncbi:MAG: deoxynucleoside kinase [Bacteroidales bacterium]